MCVCARALSEGHPRPLLFTAWAFLLAECASLITPSDFTQRYRVNVPFLTRLILDGNKADDILKPLFDEHGGRDVVMSFFGSIGHFGDEETFPVFPHLVRQTVLYALHLFCRGRTNGGWEQIAVLKRWMVAVVALGASAKEKRAGSTGRLPPCFLPPSSLYAWRSLGPELTQASPLRAL